MKSGLALLFCSLILVGCASSQTYGPVPVTDGTIADIAVVPATELPPPTPSDKSSQFRSYRIGPYDQLAIDVFGIEGFERKEYRADAGGRISYPLIGMIDAGGMTLVELENEITQRLRAHFIRNPQVTVNLVEAVSQTVAVSGQVKRPGVYPVIGRMTLVQAVARAEGLSDYAKAEDVLVFRTVNGQKMAALYNLKGINAANYEDPEIYANDVVVVGDSAERRRMDRFLALGTALMSPLILLLNRF